MMVKHLLILAMAVFVLPLHADAFYKDKAGVLDEISNEFYFDGASYNLWSSTKKYDDTTIYKYDVVKKVATKFYVSTSRVSNLTISPNLQYLAFVEEMGSKNVLVILNQQGKLVDKIDGYVEQYAWVGDSKEIIFTTGKIVDEKQMSLGRGVWLYRLISKEKLQIAKQGWNVRRVQFDDNIYFYDGSKTLRYNVTVGKVEDIDFKMEFWSPNKRYYYYFISAEAENAWEPPYWTPFRLFDTTTNSDLSAQRIGAMSERNPGDILWSSDSRKLIFSGRKTRESAEREVYVFDIGLGRIVGHYSGVIVGVNESRTKIVLVRGEDILVESII